MSQVQFLEGLGQNSNVWKDKVRIPIFGRMGPKFQGLKEQDQKWSFLKDKNRIPMFERTRPEIQCLQG